MTLQERIRILIALGNVVRTNNEEWKAIKEKAYRQNQWFIPEFVEISTKNIAEKFLKEDKLITFASQYNIAAENLSPKKVGLVMAGNIPLVGFHDMLCIFISGHHQLIKPSSKDDVLIKYLAGKMEEFNGEIKNYISFAEKLNGCDAYVATGSNNTSRYFEFYFGKYPSIIRKNRTSVAILDGNETDTDLEKLADDIQLYFGLGCRNVTKLYVPSNYNFEPLLKALEKYDHFGDFHKYRHNYDYQLALLMMGNKFYMTNGSALLSENKSVFSAISQVHYEFYTNKETIAAELRANEQIQCIVGKDFVPFGKAQQPGLSDFADGVDTMRFLVKLGG